MRGVCQKTQQHILLTEVFETCLIFVMLVVRSIQTFKLEHRSLPVAI